MEVPICTSTVGIGPFNLTTKSPDMGGLGICQYTSPQPISFSNNLPVKSVSQREPATLLLKDLECIVDVVTLVNTTDLDVVGTAVDVVNVLRVNVEGHLRVAVDTGVAEVRDCDGLNGVIHGDRDAGRCGSGDAGKESGDGELHDVCEDW